MKVTIPYDLADDIIVQGLQERYEDLSKLEKAILGKHFLEVMAYFMTEEDFTRYTLKLSVTYD